MENKESMVAADSCDKWAFLDEAMAASSKKTIKELFAEDPSRAGKFSLDAAGWHLDYSKNRVDRKAMKALVKLAEASNLKAEIERMFTGEKINRTENRAVLHTALRNCDPKAKVMVDGKEIEGNRGGAIFVGKDAKMEIFRARIQTNPKEIAEKLMKVSQSLEVSISGQRFLVDVATVNEPDDLTMLISNLDLKSGVRPRQFRKLLAELRVLLN